MNSSGLQNNCGNAYDHQGFNGTPPKCLLSEIVGQIIPFLSQKKGNRKGPSYYCALVAHCYSAQPSPLLPAVVPFPCSPDRGTRPRGRRPTTSPHRCSRRGDKAEPPGLVSSPLPPPPLPIPARFSLTRSPLFPLLARALRRRPPSISRSPAPPSIMLVAGRSAVLRSVVLDPQRELGGPVVAALLHPLPPLSPAIFVVSGEPCAPKLSQAFRSRSVSSSLPPFFSLHRVALPS